MPAPAPLRSWAIYNVPFMERPSSRYGPFGVLADALHVPLGVPITTRNIFF